jgi:hypothetical protein
VAFIGRSDEAPRSRTGRWRRWVASMVIVSGGEALGQPFQKGKSRERSGGLTLILAASRASRRGHGVRFCLRVATAWQ